MSPTSSTSQVDPREVRHQAAYKRVRSIITIGLDPWLVLLFVASRLLIVGAALAAEAIVPREGGFNPGASGPVLTSLTSWDGFFYVNLAQHGYSAAPVAGDYRNVAFAPLFPLIVRLLSWPVPGAEGLVAVLVANAAFFLALPLLVRLGTPYLGRERAGLAAGLLAIYPFASVFAMTYTESLFLLLMVGAFLAAERRHRPLAGVLLALAVLCRLQGVVLVFPLLVLLLRQDAWRPKPSLAWLALGPLAFAGFMLYIASITGSAMGYLDAQEAWGRQGLAGSAPDATIAAAFSGYQAALLLTLSWSVFLLVFVRADRIRPEYWLIPVLFLVAIVASGSLESVGRVTMLAFPYVWILANRRSTVARRIWPVLSVVLFTAIAFLSFVGIWVP